MKQDFNYLSQKDVYFDTACQTLRPEPVIKSLTDYYYHHNSCGERVKYQWGITTDQKVAETRRLVIDFLKLKKADYFTAFTLNTTYGINLLLSQLNYLKAGLGSITTTDFEHNSPFLATISAAGHHHLPRHVLPRSGYLLDPDTIPNNTLLVLGCASNVTGDLLTNIKDVVKITHTRGGRVIIDAAQCVAHHPELLHKTTADAICFSAHKTYSPSLGVIVMRHDFLPFFTPHFIGGGMVDDVELETYQLSSEPHTKFELGLQAWGEIIALSSALRWLKSQPASARQTLNSLSSELFTFLKSSPKVHLVNVSPSPTISFYLDNLDSHLLGAALSEKRIMARTGYFCVHYYLSHKLSLPPLVRLSLGYHNRPSDLDILKHALSKLL